MKHWHEIEQILHLCIVIIIVIFAGLLTASVLPIPGNYQVLTVLSGSMQPTIKTGSLIVTAPRADYKTNQIITYQSGATADQRTTHRITGTSYQGQQKIYYTKGDANEEIDPEPVPENRVQGRVILTIPYLGHLANWIKSPTGFVIAIVLPAAIIIYGEILAIRREIMKFFKKTKPTNLLLLATVSLSTLLLVTQTTRAFSFDQETSTNNRLFVSLNYNTTPSPQPTTNPSPTPLPTTTPTLTSTPTPQPQNIVINEILPHPEKRLLGEWVELYNLTDQPVSLSGWTITNSKNQSQPLTHLGEVPAHGWVVYHSLLDAWLNNNHDTVKLLNHQGDIIDQTIYDNAIKSRSFGRSEDAGETWKTCEQSTFGESNNNQC